MSCFRKVVRVLESCLPRALFRLLYGCYANVKNVCSLLFGYGQWKTCFTHKPTDANGAPIPWFTYPAIEYLEGIDLSEVVIFEFGSGYSTRYWSKRSRRVVAVEDNLVWADEVQKKLGTNALLISVKSNKEYTAAISLHGEMYDVIVIDGTDRFECANAVEGRLREGGFVILDDAEKHPDAAAVLRSFDLIEVDFAGFAPVVSYTKTTSFFFHPGFRRTPRHPPLITHSACQTRAQHP